jgi:tetratricopeptide (TPR) repeat protein
MPPVEETNDHTEAFDAVMFTSAAPPPTVDPGPPPNLAVIPRPPVPAPPPSASPALPPAAAAPRPTAPEPTRPVPPPPALPFAPKPLGVPRPAPAKLPPPPPPPRTSAPSVELDFDVAKVKARKGPKGRVARKSTGFFSRPINQISLGVAVLAGLMTGGRMAYDMVTGLFGGAGEPTSVAAAPPPPGAVAPPPAEGASTAPTAAVAAPVAAPVTHTALDPAAREEVAALMADGMRLFTEGKQFEAATQFYKVQQLDPGNLDAERMGFVACEFIAMESMHAGLAARSASETQKADAKKAALDAATAAKDGTGVEAARALVTAALALNPADPELVAAGEQLQQRVSSMARGAAVRREEKKLASLADMVAAGQKEFDKGNLTKAVRQWESVLDADPTRAAPQYYQAEEGIKAAKDQMKADTKKAYAAGLAAYKSGDLITARSQLGETVRKDPYNDAASTKLDDVRKRLKEQASEIYKEARVLEDINQTDKALGLYQKVLTYVDDAGDPLATKAQGRMNALLQ